MGRISSPISNNQPGWNQHCSNGYFPLKRVWLWPTVSTTPLPENFTIQSIGDLKVTRNNLATQVVKWGKEHATKHVFAEKLHIFMLEIHQLWKTLCQKNTVVVEKTRDLTLLHIHCFFATTNLKDDFNQHLKKTTDLFINSPCLLHSGFIHFRCILIYFLRSQTPKRCTKPPHKRSVRLGS